MKRVEGSSSCSSFSTKSEMEYVVKACLFFSSLHLGNLFCVACGVNRPGVRVGFGFFFDLELHAGSLYLQCFISVQL